MHSSGQLQQRIYSNVRLEERTYGESASGAHPEMGSLARCGCRWDEDLQQVVERVGCRLHRRRRLESAECHRCGDLEWVECGAGWDGWMLKRRCPMCNPLPSVDFREYLRRLEPCTATANWVFRGKEPKA